MNTPVNPMLKILTVAFVVGVLFLPGVAFVLLSGGDGAAESVSSTPLFVFVFGLAFLIGGHVVGVKAVKGLPRSDKINSKTLQSREQEATPRPATDFTIYIVSLAIREVSAIAGFVASFISGDITWVAASSILVVLSILFTMPRSS